MSDVKTIRKNYNMLMEKCPLTTMEVWTIQDEIQDILYEKGYDLINFCNAPCSYGYFNSIDCYTKVAKQLAEEIRAHGFNVFLIQNPHKKSISWIIFPFNLIYEIREVVEDFKELKL